MFKFDFKVSAEEDTTFNYLELMTSVSDNKVVNDCYESEEVQPDDQILDNLDVYKLNSTELLVGEVTVAYVLTGNLIQDIVSNANALTAIIKAEQDHTDLIPGVYEGGAKTWECADDLLQYLSNNFSPSFWQNKRVLDLGCGTGMLGLYAYKCQADVHFQDYNKEVLTTITIPNVMLNKTGSKNEIKFYCGDWSKFTQLTKGDEKFDVILTSETIYNPANQQTLLNTICSRLKSDGLVLVAAKSCYFGVGGSLRQFENVIAADGRLESKVVWKSSKNVGREILQLSVVSA